MALTKEVEYDKIEIVGPYKAVQCRKATIIKEDGVEISRSFHRHTICADKSISDEVQTTQNICNAVWTDEMKTAWAARMVEQEEEKKALVAEEEE